MWHVQCGSKYVDELEAEHLDRNDLTLFIAWIRQTVRAERTRQGISLRATLHNILFFSSKFLLFQIHSESLHYQSVFVEDETGLQPVQPESESEVKSLVQTVVVDYQEQWSLISFERKNAKERNRQCKDEDRKGENYLGYEKIVAKWQVLGCMDQNCLKDILERT